MGLVRTSGDLNYAEGELDTDFYTKSEFPLNLCCLAWIINADC